MRFRSLYYGYVLGKLTDEERREVEERMATDPDCRRSVKAAAHELIAAYIAGVLSTEEREALEKYLSGSEENMEKLGLAKMLYEARNNVCACPDTSNLIYRYFLGKVTDEERRMIEERLGGDPGFKQEANTAEDVLVVAYTMEEATDNRREDAQPYFFSSEKRIEKLKFAEEVYQYLRSIDLVKAQKRAISRWFGRLRQWLVSRMAEPISLSVGATSLTTDLAAAGCRCGH